jgi:ABC-2 type transport system permease protein
VKSKVAVVARREFLATVRRKAYVITTLGMPLFFLLIAGIGTIPALLVSKKQLEQKKVGVVDLSGILKVERETEITPPGAAQLDELADSPIAQIAGTERTARITVALKEAATLILVPFPNRADAQQAVRDGKVGSVFEFPANYLEKGEVLVFEKGGGLPGAGSESRQGLLGKFVVDKLLAGKVDEATVARVRKPLRTQTFTLQKNGSFEEEDILKQIGSVAVPFVFTLIFFISVMMSSGFLLEGVSEEKENRVIEVILSSIDSDRLLLGKLLGLGGAGLLQVGIWFGMVLIPAATFIARLQIHPTAVLASFVFYLLGFLLFGILLLGTGSLGQNLKESQQLGMLWSFGSVVPFWMFMLLLSEPNSTLARVLSFIPLTAPVTMFLRLNSQDPPGWIEVAAAAAALAAGAWLAWRLMSRLFRVGLLLYGKRPTIPEIFKLLRRPAA